RCGVLRARLERVDAVPPRIRIRASNQTPPAAEVSADGSLVKKCKSNGSPFVHFKLSRQIAIELKSRTETFMKLRFLLAASLVWQCGTKLSSRQSPLATATESRITNFPVSPWGLGSADGTGTKARFYLPGGVWGDDKTVYVADSGNHSIRKIVLETGQVTTLA